MNPWEFHPALLHFPLTLLLSSTVLELAARQGNRRDLALVAVGALVAGVISGVMAAVAGFVAYFTVPAHSDAVNDRIIVHGLVAASAAVLYVIVLVVRWRDRHRVANPSTIALSVVGAVLLFIAGALGGRLVYHDGVGVTAPHQDSVLRASPRGSVGRAWCEDPSPCEGFSHLRCRPIRAGTVVSFGRVLFSTLLDSAIPDAD